MKAYLTTIGEKTTGICKEQLEKYGFDVIIIDGKEKWVDKYKRFIQIAETPCIRIDADTIPNKNIKKILTEDFSGVMLAYFKGYDFYKNDIGNISPCYYSKECIDIIRINLDKLDNNRPETSMSRLSEINPYMKGYDWIVGMHGFFQDYEMVLRAKHTKVQRKQLDECDFELVDKIYKLNT
jgi:hypothetical protein